MFPLISEPLSEATPDKSLLLHIIELVKILSRWEWVYHHVKDTRILQPYTTSISAQMLLVCHSIIDSRSTARVLKVWSLIQYTKKLGMALGLCSKKIQEIKAEVESKLHD